MGERRKWERPPQDGGAAPPAFGAVASAADADPVRDKQVQYIKMLEERNRLKKKLSEAASKTQQRDKEREEAFVTTFNVGAGGGSSSMGMGMGGSVAQDTVRKNKSSAALLPTKMHGTATSAATQSQADARESKCRSAPSTTLPLRHAPGRGDDVADSETKADADAGSSRPTARRAKWSKPAQGAAFGVESRNGKARFCVGGGDSRPGDAKEIGDVGKKAVENDEQDAGGEEEEEYLEESFEAFEEDASDSDEKEETRWKMKDATATDISMSISGRSSGDDAKDIDEDIVEDASPTPTARMTTTMPVRAESKQPLSNPASSDAASSSGLSRTTTELFSVIQHLSRSKQKALVDVLHKFQSSDQRESDVAQLQSSIGDPAIWKQITSALFASDDEKLIVQSKNASESKTSALTVADVMQEQLKWEEEYARQMQERLAKEREAKEKVLRDAEERRLNMMKQLEEEELELERLMERKRRERLARLKALEDDEEEGRLSHDVVRQSVQSAATKGLVSGKAEAKSDTSATTGPAKSPVKTSPRKKKNKKQTNSRADPVLELSGVGPKVAAIVEENATFDQAIGALDAVPALDMSALERVPESRLTAETSTVSAFELRVRLLSSWGKTRSVGLTQICAYDSNGRELSIDIDKARVYEKPNGRPLPKSHEMTRGISRLFNGIAHTNSDQDMWQGRLSDAGLVEIAFEVDAAPSKLCLWNYNGKLNAACTRDVEVFNGGKCVWTGSLPQTFGDEDDNVCTWINVLPGAKKAPKTARQDVIAPNTDHSSRPQKKAVAVPDQVAPSSSGPIWLTASTSLTAIPTNEKVCSLAEAKDTSLDIDVHSARSGAGSISSRRHRGDPAESKDAAAAKSNRQLGSSKESSQWIESKQSLGTSADISSSRVQSLAPTSPSWDSLEHFSKTSRSRIPQTTDDGSLALRSSSVEQISKPVAFTSSALLTELRSMSTSTVPLPEVAATSILTTSHTGSSPAVEIPILPSGRVLRIEILSTWGDQYYVGLNGIELFDQRGRLVNFPNPERQVSACPTSINVLDEYDDDPRVPKNLVDGVNWTCDDFHMWLAPYTAGEEHFVLLDLDKIVSISMVRMWNYNKSRTHTSRGVRQVRLTLDDDAKGTSRNTRRVIFEGEIQRAPGLLSRDTGDDSMWCEVILFTKDVEILKSIEMNDTLLKTYGREAAEEEVTSAIVANVRSSMEMQRPRTSDKGRDGSGILNQDDHESSTRSISGSRPTTSVRRPPLAQHALRKSIDSWVTDEPQEKSPVLSKVVEKESEESDEGDDTDEADCDGMVRGRRIVIRLLNSWGDHNYIGLTQLDVLVGKHGTPFPLDVSNIDATPRDLASLGYHGDPRTLEKLVNGVGATCDDENMWLVPFGSSQEIRIDLKRDQFIFGLRVWNYNKSLEDTFRGVKQISVTIDGALISPRKTGYLVRKGPGTAMFDFGQVIRFDTNLAEKGDLLYAEKVQHPVSIRTYKTPIVRQDYEPALFPQGFILKFVFWTTWGDPYYLGLNGIELFDYQGRRISSRPSVITAVPHSLSDITASSQAGSLQTIDDVRVPENLLSGKDKNTWEASDTWLAPLASSIGNAHGNQVFIAFDMPIVVSLIKFWNYSKTPERGVKDMDIYLDDLHIFSGSLRRAPHGNGAHHVGRFGGKQVVHEEFSQPILFSTNQAQVDQEKRKVYYCGTEEQDVLCINEGQVVQESKAMYRKPDPGAEGVIVDLGQRPATAMFRT